MELKISEHLQKIAHKACLAEIRRLHPEMLIGYASMDAICISERIIEASLGWLEADLATAKQHVDEDMQLLSGEIASRTKAEAEVQRLQEEIKRLKAPVSDEEMTVGFYVKVEEGMKITTHPRCLFDEIIAARAEQEKGEPQP